MPLQVSSGSHVETLLLLAGTIRWLAGGSPWDIAYAFHIAYSTLHARKYQVIDAINFALKDNIDFPTTEAGLQQLADGFARIASGKGGTIPNVVAAVDSVVLQRKAPIASKERNIAGNFCRKGYFATTMLAFVDAAGRFLHISISCASSSHDSTLFGCGAHRHSSRHAHAHRHSQVFVARQENSYWRSRRKVEHCRR